MSFDAAARRLADVPRRRRGARRARTRALLRSLTGRTWREAFYLSETNYTGDLEDGTAVTHNALRVFRNRPEYRFEGRLHEQIAHCLPGYLPERIEATSMRVEHYGYLGVVRDEPREVASATSSCCACSRPRARRRRSCTTTSAASTPPPATPRPRSPSSSARGSCCEAAADRDSHKFAPALMSRLVKALRACGRPHEALARAEDGLERFPGFTDLVLEQALAR